MFEELAKMAFARKVLRGLSSYRPSDDLKQYWDHLPKKRLAAGAALMGGLGLMDQATNDTQSYYQGFNPRSSQ